MNVIDPAGTGRGNLVQKGFVSTSSFGAVGRTEPSVSGEAGPMLVGGKGDGVGGSRVGAVIFRG